MKKEVVDVNATSHRLDSRVWLLALGTFAVGTDANVISGILNQLASDFRVPLNSAGSIISLYSITYAISAPFLAALAGRMRKHRVVIAALVLFGVANVVCAVAPTYSLLLAARVLAGLAAGIYTPTAYGLAASLARPERKGVALATVALGITGSIVLGVPLGIIVGRGFGWHATFWMIGGFSLGASIVIGLRPPRQSHATSSGPSVSQRLAPLVQPRMLLALLPTVILCIAVQATYTYLGALLLKHGFTSNAVVVTIFLMFGLGGLFGSQAGGRLVDRFGSTPVIVVSLIAGVVDTAIFRSCLSNAMTVSAASFILSFVAWPVVIGQQRRLMRLSPSHTDVLLALNNSCIYVGVAGGATTGAVILRYGHGLDRIPSVSSFLLVLTLLVYWTSTWLESRQLASPRNYETSVRLSRSEDSHSTSSVPECVGCPRE